MSSHREAPTISKDPVADNTDLYAFVDPVDTSKVTILSNFITLEEPAGGPNFFQFGDDVLYEILIDNNGDGVEDVTYQFRFKTTTQNPATFLYNTGPIGSLTDPNWNVRQLYSVTKVVGPRRTGSSAVLGSDLPTPPVRIGPRSTPNYETLAGAAVSSLGGGVKTFAGQRGEGFYVDLGSIFDLGTLRPFQNLHLIRTPAAPGVNGTKGFNVHTIAIQVPNTDLTRNGFNPSDPADRRSVIGVWSAASRRKGTIREKNARIVQSGPWVQVSRLGEPLINEVVIELGEKDLWNSQTPDADSQFLDDYAHPQLQGLLPALYPGVFPNLAALSGTGASRADPSGRVASEPRLRAELSGDGLGHQSARGQHEALRPPRGRPGRLPERSAGVRQRDRGRVARDRGCHVPVDRQQLHAGRRRRAAHGRDQRGSPVHPEIPLPGGTVRRIRALARPVRRRRIDRTVIIRSGSGPAPGFPPFVQRTSSGLLP